MQEAVRRFGHESDPGEIGPLYYLHFREEEVNLSFLVLDGRGKIVSVSANVQEAIGPVEIIGIPFSDVIHAAQAGLFLEALESCQSTGASHYLLLNLKGLGGNNFEIILKPGVAGDEDYGFLVIARRIRPHEVVDGEEARLQAFMELITIVCDGNGRVMAFNNQAEKATGFLKWEVFNRPVWETLGRNWFRVDEYKDLLASDLKEGSLIDLPLNDRRGDPLNIKWRAVRLESLGGGAGGLLLLSEGNSSNEDWEPIMPESRKYLEILAQATGDITRTYDFREAISQDIDGMLKGLSLDFSIFRLTFRNHQPMMFCSGIDFREGRKILQSKIIDDQPLFKAIRGRGVMAIGDASETLRAEGIEDICSMICIPLIYRGEFYGCAVFGTKHHTSDIKERLPVLQVFCNQVAISFRNMTLSKELMRRNKELSSLHETSRALSGTLDPQEILEAILSRAKELVDADHSFLFQFNEDRNRLRCVCFCSDCPDEVQDIELKVGEGITGMVAQRGEGILVQRADSDERSIHVDGTPDGPSSIISIPLLIGDDMVGVMTLEKSSMLSFDRSDYNLIEMFSFQAATALKNARLFHSQQEYATHLQVYNDLLTHDVANYNVPIHGFLELLVTDPKLDSKQRRFIEKALSQSDNISSLVYNVRKLNRLRQANDEVALEMIDMIPVIRATIEELQEHPSYVDVPGSLSTGVGEAMVMADALLKDIFFNLLSNAYKHAGGEDIVVTVEAHEEGGNRHWRVNIIDNGPGIPDDRKPLIFKRFYKMASGKRAEGRGLGLSVVAALCNRYNGRVWVEDRVEGDHTKGSVFSVILPRVDIY
jgi:signal transduction histidine kinase